MQRHGPGDAGAVPRLNWDDDVFLGVRLRSGGERR